MPLKPFWRAPSSSLNVGTRRPSAPHSFVASGNVFAARWFGSKHSSSTRIVPPGQETRYDSGVAPPSLDALADVVAPAAVSAVAALSACVACAALAAFVALSALGTLPSFASRTSVPVTVFFLSFLPATLRFLRLLPLIRPAAYEVPPTASTSASVATTFAYEMRGRDRRFIGCS